MHLRRSLLQWHQALGFVTLVALAATDVIGTLSYYDKYTAAGSDTGAFTTYHEGLGIGTASLFGITGILALAAPNPYPKPLRLDAALVHKLSMLMATACFAAQIVMGPIMAVSDGKLYQKDMALAHLVIGYGAFAFMGAAPWRSYSEGDREVMKMDRRRFLKTTAAGGALISIGVAPQGCGNPVSAAPLAKVITNATPDVPASIEQATLFDSAQLDSATYGTVQLLVEFYPQLVPVGGAITLQLGSEIVSSNSRGYSVPIDNTILLIHQNDDPTIDNFLALQSSCPHAGLPARLQRGRQAGRVPLPLVALLRRQGGQPVRRQRRCTSRRTRAS